MTPVPIKQQRGKNAMSRPQGIQIAWIVAAVSITSAAVQWGGGVFSTGEDIGTICTKVDHNTEMLKKIDEKGSVATQRVKEELIEVRGIAKRNEADIQLVLKTINNQYEALMAEIRNRL
jgi:hypothetical protein